MNAVVSATVCVFAKAPNAGEAKTRLAPALGEQRAAELARAFLLDTLHEMGRVSGVSTILATAGILAPELEARLGEVEQIPQGDGDLGARLERVLRGALTGSKAALAVGADAPGLEAAHIHGALNALEDHDAVLGPAEDGGFYLLGLTHVPEGLLEDLPWSSAGVLEATRARLEQHGLSVALLPPLFDVDQPEDLDRLRDSLNDTGSGALGRLQHTRAACARWGIG